MATFNLEHAKNYYRVNQYVVAMLSVIALLLMGYYVATSAFPYFIVTEESYGTYFFPRALWLLPHIIFSLVAIVVGPIQFIPQIRTKYLKLHRRLGRIYIVSVVLGGMIGMYLAITSGVNLPYAVGLFCLGFTWVVSAIMALLSIKNKKVELHKEWMIRSYIITFAFVTFRFVEDILMALEIGSWMEVLVLVSWASWAVPLFVGEVIIQGMKIKKAWV